MIGKREQARYVLCQIDYLKYEVCSHYMCYKLRMFRTDISEEQLQYLVTILQEKQLMLRTQLSYLMFF